MERPLMTRVMGLHIQHARYRRPLYSAYFQAIAPLLPVRTCRTIVFIATARCTLTRPACGNVN